MKKKIVKILSIVMMVLMVVLCTQSVFASWDDIDINTFNGKSDKSGVTNTMSQVMASIINVIQVVGMGIAIVMLIYVAIKYISAAPAEKAEFKKMAMTYIVGAIVLFAASGILQLIKGFATQNINNGAVESTKSGALLVINTVQNILG